VATIARRRRTARRELGVYKRHELITGRIMYPQLDYDGYGDGVSRDLSDFISEDMRLDWQANRDVILQWWASCENEGYLPPPIVPPWLAARGSLDLLPWAGEQFDEDPDATLRELRVLADELRRAKS
jgi:hypothetical protein